MLTRLLFKALSWLLVLMLPIGVLMIPLMPMYDWLRPWDSAVAALKEEEVAGIRWMVGFESSVSKRNGEVTRSSRSRDFVVIPEVFWRATVYEYSEATDRAPVLKAKPGGAIAYLIMYAVLVGISWFVCRPKVVELIQKNIQPNQAPLPTPGKCPPSNHDPVPGAADL